VFLNREYTHLEDCSDFEIPKGAKSVAVDVEATGLNPRRDRIVGLSFAFDRSRAYYVSDIPKNQDFIRSLLGNKNLRKVFHNAVYDVSMLEAAGFKTHGVIICTMILAHRYNPDLPSLGLKALAEENFGPDAVKQAKKMAAWLADSNLPREGIAQAPASILIPYSCEDTLNAVDLANLYTQKHLALRAWLAKRGYKKSPYDYYFEEDAPIIPVVVEMQRLGVKIDLEKTAIKEAELTARIRVLTEGLRQTSREQVEQTTAILYQQKVESKLAKSKTGKLKKPPPPIVFNWASSDHLRVLFFQVLGEKKQKTTKKGNSSVDAEVLLSFAKKYPWLNMLLEIRELSKLTSTYLKSMFAIQEGGVVHANFNITGTRTGRFSSNNPNLQNLPKHGGIKDLFVPRAGCVFVEADYSQLELRIAAHLSQDSLLLRVFQEGLDLHQITADALNITRDEGKTINFAIMYGARGWRVASILGYMAGISDDDKNALNVQARRGDKVVDKLFSKYGGLKTYIDETESQQHKYLMSLSEFGFMRRFPDLRLGSGKHYSHARKAAGNLPIQSFGISLIKRVMREFHHLGFSIVNQVHDSLIFEIKDSELATRLPVIKQTMENIYKLSVPLKADFKIKSSFQTVVKNEVAQMAA